VETLSDSSPFMGSCETMSQGVESGWLRDCRSSFVCEGGEGEAGGVMGERRDRKNR
jgi:hypothetical protein